jgi:hypothetical protein
MGPNMTRKAAAALALALATAATGSVAQDSGALRQLGEAAIRDHLLDPYSAVIEWSPEGFIQVTGITQGKWIFKRPLVTGPALLGCGMVNAKNRMGGYTGRQAFEVAIQTGAVVLVDMDEGGSQDAPLTLQFCEARASRWATARHLAPSLPPRRRQVRHRPLQRQRQAMSS